MAIDVGATCIDRSDNLADGYTPVSKDNPANATGTIDSVCVYAVSGMDMSGIEYASFADGGSNNLTTNGDTDGSNLSASGQTTHTAAGNDFTAFAININEYIGAYWTGGRVERHTEGYSGRWWQNADKIPDVGSTYNVADNQAVSIYGTGTEAGGATPKAVAGSLAMTGALARKATFKRAIAGVL